MDMVFIITVSIITVVCYFLLIICANLFISIFFSKSFRIMKTLWQARQRFVITSIFCIISLLFCHNLSPRFLQNRWFKFFYCFENPKHSILQLSSFRYCITTYSSNDSFDFPKSFFRQFFSSFQESFNQLEVLMKLHFLPKNMLWFHLSVIAPHLIEQSVEQRFPTWGTHTPRNMWRTFWEYAQIISMSETIIMINKLTKMLEMIT